MLSETALRIADSLLALFWFWVLVQSHLTGRIAGVNGFKFSKTQRPAQYWGWMVLLALMVLHFGGLAWTGQKV
jgi:uncharacterized membrane protein